MVAGDLRDGSDLGAAHDDGVAAHVSEARTVALHPGIENLHGIVHTELPGVCVTFDRDSLPEGDYLIGFLWEDTCSRQKLYRFSPEMLTVRK